VTVAKSENEGLDLKNPRKDKESTRRKM